MNPSQYVEPQQLFGASMHAGGWPKLGWQHNDNADNNLASDDEPDQSLEG